MLYDAKTAFQAHHPHRASPVSGPPLPASLSRRAQLLAHAKAARRSDLWILGVGGLHHLSGELLASPDLHTQLTHASQGRLRWQPPTHRASHPAMAMFEMGYSALPSIKSQKINALAVSSKTSPGRAARGAHAGR